LTFTVTVLVTLPAPVGFQVTCTATLPLRATFSFRAAVPAFLTVLEALPTVLDPALAVAESLPGPETLTASFRPARLEAAVTLTESVAFDG
jgi:hypothetical protein